MTLVKHLSGKHDQQTHGNWAHGSSWKVQHISDTPSKSGWLAEWRDEPSNGTLHRLRIIGPDKTVIGRALWSTRSGSPKLKSLDVHRTYRRHGVASAMLDHIESLYPNNPLLFDERMEQMPNAALVLASFRRRQKVKKAFLKHLQGSHDQRTHGSWSRGVSSPQVASEVTSGSFEGKTVHHISGDTPTSGYGVSRSGAEEFHAGLRIAKADKVASIVRVYRNAHESDLVAPGVFLGMWAQGDDIYLDISENPQDLDSAMDMARRNNQQGIWDFNDSKYIPNPDYAKVAA